VEWKIASSGLLFLYLSERVRGPRVLGTAWFAFWHSNWHLVAYYILYKALACQAN
jgi:hypothetical protein